jgi:hypothetical protein
MAPLTCLRLSRLQFIYGAASGGLGRLVAGSRVFDCLPSHGSQLSFHALSNQDTSSCADSNDALQTSDAALKS